MENLGINSSWWSGRRVLVTGHNGFKGSWLCHMLMQLGAEVSGLSLKNGVKDSVFESTNLSSFVVEENIDIRHYESVYKFFKERQPEVIFHLAAQPLVLESYKNPIDTYETNVMGTLNVLMAASNVKTVAAIINITTDKVYENKEWCWSYREDDPLGGHDPYSSSKACSEILSKSVAQSFLSQKGIKIATARAGNVIGGGDVSSNRLIPDIMSSLLEGNEIAIRNPDSIRPWQHVLDPLHGYLLLAEKLIDKQVPSNTSWNFGPSGDGNSTVEFVVDTLCKIWGNGAEWKRLNLDQHHEAKNLMLDISKARDKLGWKPKYSLTESIEYTVNWYKAQKDLENMEEYTINQIKSFMSM